jgi:hypothetical protein
MGRMKIVSLQSKVLMIDGTYPTMRTFQRRQKKRSFQMMRIW